MAKCVLTLEDIEDEGRVNISIDFVNALQAQGKVTPAQDIAMRMVGFAADLIETNEE